MDLSNTLATSRASRNLAVHGMTLTIKWGDTSTQPAREIPRISKSPVVITAIDTRAGKNEAVALHSLYPQLGIVFLAHHYLNATGGEDSQSTLYAKCEFAAGLVSEGSVK